MKILKYPIPIWQPSYYSKVWKFRLGNKNILNLGSVCVSWTWFVRLWLVDFYVVKEKFEGLEYD
jgi:hypothetical protein